MKKFERTTKIENKYDLKPKDIQRAIVLDYKALHEAPFWRNNAIKAWCLSGGVGRGVYSAYDYEYWIGFYDNDAPTHAGEIEIYCTCFEGMSTYDFKDFFNPYEIDNIDDLVFQEKLLEVMNWLIDSKIIYIEKEAKKMNK